MLRFEAHTKNIFQLVKDNLVMVTDDHNPDITVVCKDNEIVKTHKNILCVFSPTLRDILGSVFNMNSPMLSLPEFSRRAVERVIRLLSFDWTEDEIWEFEVVELLKILNIKVGSFQYHEQQKDEKKEDSKTSLVRDVTNHQDSEDLQIKQILGDKNAEISENLENVRKEDKNYETKCPRCPLYISGTTSIIRTKMKLHLGQVHFPLDLDLEMKACFGSSNKCNKCDKIFRNASSQKQHLIFNHTNPIQILQIQSIVNTVIKELEELSEPNIPEQNPCILETRILNKKNDAEKIIEKKSNVLIEPRNSNEKIDTVKKSNVLLEPQEENHMNKNGMLNGGTFRCVFPNCKKSWEKLKKSNISQHIILTHFKQQVSEERENYFHGSKCIKCPDVEIHDKHTSKIDIHMHSRHGVLKKEVNDILNQIKDNSQISIHYNGSPEHQIEKDFDDETVKKPNPILETDASHPNSTEDEEDASLIPKSDAEENEDIKDIETPIFSNTHVYTCEFNCKTRWREFRSKHIGDHVLTHFKRQMSKMHKDYFEGFSCRKCSKRNTLFSQDSVRNRHLYHKHGVMKKEVREILQQIENNSQISTHNDGISVKQSEKYIDEETVEKPNPTYETDTSTPNSKLPKSDIRENENIADIVTPISTNTCEYTCEFNCKKRWKEFHTKAIRQHILTHFKHQMSKMHKYYFEGLNCRKCSIHHDLFSQESFRNRHLHHKHGVMKNEILHILNRIKNNSKLEGGKSSFSEKCSTKSRNTGNMTPKMNADQDSDLLLQSDDEDYDDSMDIQNMLTADVSDYDSDEEVEILKNDDDDELDMEIQNKLLESQDLSDSDTEDENIGDDVNKYMEDDTFEERIDHESAKKRKFLKTKKVSIQNKVQTFQKVSYSDTKDEIIGGLDDNDRGENTSENQFDNAITETNKVSLKFMKTEALEVSIQTKIEASQNITESESDDKNKEGHDDDDNIDGKDDNDGRQLDGGNIDKVEIKYTDYSDFIQNKLLQDQDFSDEDDN